MRKATKGPLEGKVIYVALLRIFILLLKWINQNIRRTDAQRSTMEPGKLTVTWGLLKAASWGPRSSRCTLLSLSDSIIKEIEYKHAQGRRRQWLRAPGKGLRMRRSTAWNRRRHWGLESLWWPCSWLRVSFFFVNCHLLLITSKVIVSLDWTAFILASACSGRLFLLNFCFYFTKFLYFLS